MQYYIVIIIASIATACWIVGTLEAIADMIVYNRYIRRELRKIRQGK